jgi:hypothetical protein
MTTCTRLVVASLPGVDVHASGVDAGGYKRDH